MNSAYEQRHRQPQLPGCIQPVLQWPITVKLQYIMLFTYNMMRAHMMRKHLLDCNQTPTGRLFTAVLPADRSPAAILNHEVTLRTEARLWRSTIMKWTCITEECLSLVFLYGREWTFMRLTHFTNWVFWIFKCSCLKSVWDENLDRQILWDNQQASLLHLL